jgi:hypothetical protein
MPDGIRPWPDQRVAWVLSFFERLYGRPDAAEVAESLKLTGLLQSRIGSLSKGESKRLLVALGLLTPQPLLLLDEPFDGLDFRQTRDMIALLHTLPERGRTLFLSIHQLTDAARVSTASFCSVAAKWPVRALSTSSARSPAFPRAAWRRSFLRSRSALPPLIFKELRVGGDGTLDVFRALAGVPRAACRRFFLRSHSALPLLISKEPRVGGEDTLDELRELAGVPEGGLEEVFLGLT